jgi:pantetheine-phosphate adenylyltransferase
LKKAIYPGSFDPVTYGHLDIIRRAAGLFDSLTVLVMTNSAKRTLFSPDERVKMIQGLVKDYPNVNVEATDRLLVDYARDNGKNIVVRGLRTTTDFEYELQLAHIYKKENEGLETVFLATEMEYSYLSSTVVREFASYHGDISPFVPASIIPLIEEKYR